MAPSSRINFLSPLSNFDQLIFTYETRQKLCANKIIEFFPNNLGFDLLALPANTHLQTTFPNCVLDKVPYKINTKAFIEYLGIHPTLAEEIFCQAARKTHGIINGEILLNELKIYVEESINEENIFWQKSFGVGVLPDSLDNNTIMGWLAFDEDIIVEVNQLMYAASQIPDKMKDYLNQEKPDKVFEDLKLVDYIIQIFLQRVENLICLEQVIKKYMDENPS